MYKFIAAILFLTLPFSVNASVIVAMDGGSYEWLELDQTAGMNRDQVELELVNVASDLYGYEYASRSQVESMLLSYASWDGLTGWHAEASALNGMNDLFNDFNGALQTSPGNGTNGSLSTVDGYTAQYDGYIQFFALYGLEAECGGGNVSCVATHTLFSDASGTPSMVLQRVENGFDSTYPSSSMSIISDDATLNFTTGSFLVRTAPVPVPAALWLFGSALGGLGWMRRRKTA